MNNNPGRALQRGKPLDRDCHKAKRTTHEYGHNDDRVFCYGLQDLSTEEPLAKCSECGAFVGNLDQAQNIKLP